MLIVRANERPYGGARVFTQHAYELTALTGKAMPEGDREVPICRTVWARSEESLREVVGRKAPRATIVSIVATGATRKRMKRPTTATLRRWIMDSVVRATDGCKVEPDGTCPHGAQSWLTELGIC